MVGPTPTGAGRPKTIHILKKPHNNNELPLNLYEVVEISRWRAIASSPQPSAQHLPGRLTTFALEGSPIASQVTSL